MYGVAPLFKIPQGRGKRGSRRGGTGKGKRRRGGRKRKGWRKHEGRVGVKRGGKRTEYEVERGVPYGVVVTFPTHKPEGPGSISGLVDGSNEHFQDV